MFTSLIKDGVGMGQKIKKITSPTDFAAEMVCCMKRDFKKYNQATISEAFKKFEGDLFIDFAGSEALRSYLTSPEVFAKYKKFKELNPHLFPKRKKKKKEEKVENKNKKKEEENVENKGKIIEPFSKVFNNLFEFEEPWISFWNAQKKLIQESWKKKNVTAKVSNSHEEIKKLKRELIRYINKSIAKVVIFEYEFQQMQNRIPKLLVNLIQTIEEKHQLQHIGEAFDVNSGKQLDGRMLFKWGNESIELLEIFESDVYKSKFRRLFDKWNIRLDEINLNWFNHIYSILFNKILNSEGWQTYIKKTAKNNNELKEYIKCRVLSSIILKLTSEIHTIENMEKIRFFQMWANHNEFDHLKKEHQKICDDRIRQLCDTFFNRLTYAEESAENRSIEFLKNAREDIHYKAIVNGEEVLFQKILLNIEKDKQQKANYINRIELLEQQKKYPKNIKTVKQQQNFINQLETFLLDQSQDIADLKKQFEKKHGKLEKKKFGKKWIKKLKNEVKDLLSIQKMRYQDFLRYSKSFKIFCCVLYKDINRHYLFAFKNMDKAINPSLRELALEIDKFLNKETRIECHELRTAAFDRRINIQTERAPLFSEEEKIKEIKQPTSMTPNEKRKRLLQFHKEFTSRSLPQMNRFLPEMNETPNEKKIQRLVSTSKIPKSTGNNKKKENSKNYSPLSYTKSSTKLFQKKKSPRKVQPKSREEITRSVHKELAAHLFKKKKNEDTPKSLMKRASTFFSLSKPNKSNKCSQEKSNHKTYEIHV